MPPNTEPHSYLYIQGHSLPVPQKWAEGHVLTALEAEVLQHYLRENLRNYWKQRLSGGDAKLGDSQSIKEAFWAYALAYDFSRVLTRSDPLESEARAIAKDYVAMRLQAQGRLIATVPKDELEELISEMAQTPQVQSEAARRAALKKSAAQDVLEEMTKGLAQEGK